MFSKFAVQNLRSTSSAWRRAASKMPLEALQHTGFVLPQASLPAEKISRKFLSSSTTKKPFSTQAMPEKVDMFCRQCEQTRDHIACTTVGICGKSSETAAIQDTLVHLVKSVSQWAVVARQLGITDLTKVNEWTVQASFSTLTNVNFSDERIAQNIHEGMELLKTLKAAVKDKDASAVPSEDLALEGLEGMSVMDLEDFGTKVSIPERQMAMGNDDAFSLNEIATYGLKGCCAYVAHCYQLGVSDDQVMAEIHQVFAKIASSEPDMEGLLAACLKVGEINAKVLGMLDEAHVNSFGVPEPTPVLTTAVEGKAILVSGHDMKDLYELLRQTEGTGIHVYTHGEMLPAHGYPELKKFKHLVGNYGTAWQSQKFEFASFPGPVVVTTNCLLEPRKKYKNRIFTMNEVGSDGVQHIGPDRDFKPVINEALKAKGFSKTINPPSFHTVGFNHRVVLPLAEKILEAAKAGELSRIFVIGGCDGSQWERNYFTELANATPDDSLILTLGCAKNRVIQNRDLLKATLANGLPRVLDMGQCNDSYSAVVVALELAKALDCSVNDLPLSLAISHLEQKAAAVLLTLLSLGVKNVRLGPSLPSYISPNVLDILSKEYNLMPTGEPSEDLAKMMLGK